MHSNLIKNAHLTPHTTNNDQSNHNMCRIKGVSGQHFNCWNLSHACSITGNYCISIFDARREGRQWVLCCNLEDRSKRYIWILTSSRILFWYSWYNFITFCTFWYRFVSFTSWQRTLPKEFLKLTVSVASTPTPISSRIMLEHCKFSISNSNSISIADLDSLLKISVILTWSRTIFWAWSTLIIGHWETLALPATPTPPLSPWAGRWSK